MIQGRPTGKRERFYFETETEAKKAVADRNRQIAAFGSQNTLPDSDRVMAAECIKMLIPFGKTLYDGSVLLNTKRMSITPKAIQDLLDELEASKQSRLRAWNVLQRLRSVLSEAGNIAIPPPGRKTFDAEGEALEHALTKSFRIRNEAIKNLCSSVRRFRDATIKEECKRDYPHALQALWKALDRAEDLIQN